MGAWVCHHFLRFACLLLDQKLTRFPSTAKADVSPLPGDERFPLRRFSAGDRICSNAHRVA